jgi:hypothetical protein
MACDIPEQIEAAERVTRAILTPMHVKRGAIKAMAFRPKRGSDDLSVMRSDHMAQEDVMAHAKDLESPVNKLHALVSVSVGDVRSGGGDVIDSRSEFCGHAHISQGFVVPPDPDGAPPEATDLVLLDKMTQRAQALLDKISVDFLAS